MEGDVDDSEDWSFWRIWVEKEDVELSVWFKTDTIGHKYQYGFW